MRILLAEDNLELSGWLARLLRRDHYVIDCVHDGDEADAALMVQDYALVLLDLSLPGLNGLDVLKNLRRRGRPTPVMILTASDSIAARVAGLDAGADDYLAKPFDIHELEARIRALLRRSVPGKASLIEFGPLTFDSTLRSFTLNGAVLALTPREHAVLETMLRAAPRTTPKGRLAENVFGFDDEANPNAVEVYVHRVRKKLEGGGIGIATLRGLGYVLRRTDAA